QRHADGPHRFLRPPRWPHRLLLLALRRTSHRVLPRARRGLRRPEIARQGSPPEPPQLTMPVDKAEAVRAISAFLRALGRDPERDRELVGTPERVVEAWANELIEGYDVDVPALLLGESSPAPRSELGLVVLRGLSVSTMCPHHLLPARGTATVLYLP